MKLGTILILITMLVFPIISDAQEKALKFLGIPVDGNKSEMIRKLENKGYVHSRFIDDDVLQGEFNGTDVNIYVVTNNNKVWRIYLADDNPMDEYQIKLRFNTLCEQFSNNSKYTSFNDDQTIPMEEDISYEMSMNDKHYEAVFYQVPEVPSFMRDFEKYISNLQMPQDSSASVQQKDMIELWEKVISYLSLYDEEKFSKYNKEFLYNLNLMSKEELLSSVLGFTKDYLSILENRTVWFTISDTLSGEYYISMYYDNGYNQASGEDL